MRLSARIFLTFRPYSLRQSPKRHQKVTLAVLIMPSEFTHGGEPKGCAIFASELLGGMVFLGER